MALRQEKQLEIDKNKKLQQELTTREAAEQVRRDAHEALRNQFIEAQASLRQQQEQITRLTNEASVLQQNLREVQIQHGDDLQELSTRHAEELATGRHQLEEARDEFSRKSAEAEVREAHLKSQLEQATNMTRFLRNRRKETLAELHYLQHYFGEAGSDARERWKFSMTTDAKQPFLTSAEHAQEVSHEEALTTGEAQLHQT
jgi:uncharacterized phage infection (PIP) family protein YhgE